MADDIETNKPNEQQEEEYSYPGPETKEFGVSPHSGGTETIASLLQNKRILSVIGGVIALYLVMSIFSGGGDSFEDLDIEPANDNMVSMSEPAAQPMPAPTPVFSAFAEIEDDEEEESQQSAEIERLKTQLSSLARQASDSRKRLKKLESQVDTIAKSSIDNSAKLSKLIKTQEDQVSEKKKDVVLQDYKIRALISSRAWLEDKFGNNITVKIGDNIPTYGRVTKIKPVEGVVETSSGRFITFALNE